MVRLLVWLPPACTKEKVFGGLCLLLPGTYSGLLLPVVLSETARCVCVCMFVCVPLRVRTYVCACLIC